MDGADCMAMCKFVNDGFIGNCKMDMNKENHLCLFATKPIENRE